MNDIDQGLLRLGTASWSCSEWRGVFYAAKSKPADYITEYAQHFSTVEIDSTFYAIPSRSTVQAWRDKTPEGFIFSAKVPQIITHEKFMMDCPKEMEQFLDTMAILGDRLGPILLQFPYFARKTGVDLNAFLERLSPFLHSMPKADFQFVVEIRNKTWLKPQLLDLLSQHQVPLALIDHPWMPGPAELFRIKGIITGPFAYIRWLGDRVAMEKITQRWDKSVIDRTSDLEQWLSPVHRLLKQQIPVYGYCNSHYSGYAPGDAKRFQDSITNRAAHED